MSDPVICPECVQGKHGNCNGEAWDMLGDFPADCACGEVQHDEALLGGRNEFGTADLCDFTTHLGCRVRVVPAPEHLGIGVMLMLSVDTRFAEVFLNPEAKRLLREGLD
jgi:hypothetical protein